MLPITASGLSATGSGTCNVCGSPTFVCLLLLPARISGVVSTSSYCAMSSSANSPAGPIVMSSCATNIGGPGLRSSRSQRT